MNLVENRDQNSSYVRTNIISHQSRIVVFSTGVDLFINPFCKQVVYNSSVSGHSTQLIKADLHTGSVMVEQELRKVLPITKYSPY